jgi:TonB family protein
MHHALLLSPDDQAVSAITGVLEELSVTCERPLDGVSAAQKLNSQSFDLVLVDCENLPAAKLIFDVCRRGKDGHNPVPIAIVDGRAGLPTAFRLGAELILTKPVAKDQARSTIRAAVGRVRKDVPASESVAHPETTAAIGDLHGAVATAARDEHAHAAAAGASSLHTSPLASSLTPPIASPLTSPLTSFADSAPSHAPSAVSGAGVSAAPGATPDAVSNTALFASTLTTKMNSAVQEIGAAPVAQKPKSRPASLPTKPSDDPVLAEIERTELEEAVSAEAVAVDSPKPSLEAAKTTSNRAATKSVTPVFSSYQGRQKPRGALVAMLGLVIAGAGFYAAWTYQPGFKEIAQPQIDRVLALAGLPQLAQSPIPSLAPATATTGVKPAAQPVPAGTLAPATGATLGATTDPNQVQSAVTNPTTTPTGSSPAISPATLSASTAQTVATPPAAVVVPAAGTAAPVVAKAADNKASEKLSDTKSSAKGDGLRSDNSKKDAEAATSADAVLPGESTAIILSSKGAEKRLAHGAPPKYPAGAQSKTVEGTVVLKEIVDENGKVKGVRLVEGDAGLATAAIAAVKQWRYRPYVRDGKALPFQTVVIVDFSRP